jgi:hypothetical protein
MGKYLCYHLFSNFYQDTVIEHSLVQALIMGSRILGLIAENANIPVGGKRKCGK